MCLINLIKFCVHFRYSWLNYYRKTWFMWLSILLFIICSSKSKNLFGMKFPKNIYTICGGLCCLSSMFKIRTKKIVWLVFLRFSHSICDVISKNVPWDFFLIRPFSIRWNGVEIVGKLKTQLSELIIMENEMKIRTWKLLLWERIYVVGCPLKMYNWLSNEEIFN